MRIVLDTNVLLVCISDRSKYYSIFDAFVNEEYELCVTTDILLEYEEIIKEHMGSFIAEYVLDLIENAPNVKWITRYYKWNLIVADPDDNKFADCAIACDAKYLVSDDKHFRVLGKIAFPKIDFLTATEFKKIIKRK